ncbi:hypothetical protein B0H13DRAFT_140548 [Mycena leptocephala]|nr:hypothetical protein B0H13DRAFT_140548 [Mycena leptocephala]
MAESDDSVPHPDPRLPPELERTIFEIVALSRPSGIPNLMLVAARVKAWIEPLLYRIVLCRTSRLRQIKFVGFPASTITVETLLRLAATTGSPSVIQNSIRHLFLDGFLDGFPVSDRVDAILTACSGVTNLFAHFHAAPIWVRWVPYTASTASPSTRPRSWSHPLSPCPIPCFAPSRTST